MAASGRADPHPTDPEQCVFDMLYFTWFPEEKDRYFSYSMGEEVDQIKPVPHNRGKVGAFSYAPGIDQGISIWSQQQRGLRSRGYHGGHLSGQESRVRFFHHNIDRCQTQEYTRFENGNTRAVGGLYEDEMVKIDGRWFYAKRVFGIIAGYDP
jgi:Ring hydroxylating alpha subunit (catalytic domain)